MTVSFVVGQRLTASALQDAFDFITPQTFTKPAVSARSSTTTYAIDDDLKLISLAVGVYEVELVGFFTLTTTATQKIKTQWCFTGTWNSPIRNCIGPGFAQTAGPASATESSFSTYISDSQDAIYDVSAGGTYTCFREVARNVTVTVAGTMALYWAQVASSANATNLQAGTSFTVRRIS